MSRLRWLLPALILLVWLGSAAPLSALGAKLTGLQENDIAAFLPDSAESTRVQELQAGFQPTESIPALLLWESDGGIDEATLAEIGERIEAATQVAEDADALAGAASPPIPSEDGEAVQAFLPLVPDLGDDLLPLVDDLRAAIEVDGTDSFVTGPAGIFADFSSAFEGIDGLLLLAAFGVVLVILLVVYRSPLLPFLVIATAGLALTAANAVAYLLADGGVITVNGQSQGIASILVVGAATDYGLLLVARFREELRREQSKYAAMRIALRQSWEPIVASGATVVLGVLCLLLLRPRVQPRARPDLRGQRHPRRPRRAHLPARGADAARPGRVLAVPPAVRRRAQAGPRLAAGRRPRRPPSPPGARAERWRLIAAAVFAPTYDADGIPISDAIQGESNGMAGQEALGRHFDAGTGSPTVIITPEETWPEVAEMAAATDGVAAVVPFTGGPPVPGAQPVVVDGLVRLDATLDVAPDSVAAIETVKTLRTTLDDADPRGDRRRRDGEQPRRPGERRPRPAGDHPERPRRHHARAGAAAAVAGRSAAARRDRGAQRRRDGGRGRAAVRRASSASPAATRRSC